MQTPQNIQQRSEVFAFETIKYCKSVNRDIFTTPLIKQVIRSSTSIGANLSETTYAYSKKEFLQKTTIALKEANETAYWLRLLDKCNNKYDKPLVSLLNEVNQIIAILVTITKHAKEKQE